MSQVSFIFQEEDGIINISFQENEKEISSQVREVSDTILSLVKEVEEKGYLQYSPSGLFAKSVEGILEESMKESKCCKGHATSSGCGCQPKQELTQEEKSVADTLAKETIDKTSKQFKCKEGKCSGKCSDKNKDATQKESVEENSSPIVILDVTVIGEEIALGIKSNPAIDIKNGLTNLQSIALMIVDNLSNTYQMS